jgi:hypothetical protein
VILDAAMQEIDMKTGLVRWEWHSLDHVAAIESETSPADKHPWDWFHLNSIDPQPNGDVFISARNTWAGYQLQAGTGQILWTPRRPAQLIQDGPGNEDGVAARRAHPPQRRGHASSTTARPARGSSQSRGVRIALDFTTHRRAGVRLHHPEPAAARASQGNMQTLADGNTVVATAASRRSASTPKAARCCSTRTSPTT